MLIARHARVELAQVLRSLVQQLKWYYTQEGGEEEEDNCPLIPVTEDQTVSSAKKWIARLEDPATM